MIKEIDAESAAQLKSGQVIVELGNALKELVENAIDANATAITVKVHNYGLDEIQVSDNGDGIDPADFNLVASPHSTSKLSSFDDLTQIATLGFRGEALASLCSVAKVHIQTSQGNGGYSLDFNSDGSLAKQSNVAAPKGTTVTISDFFHRLPVRRKDLERNYKRKYTDAIRVVQSYAIIWNGTLVIEHILKDGKRSTVLRAQGQDISDRISLVFGAKTAKNLVEIDSKSENVQITGRISRPMALMKGQRSSTRLVYINGRPINDNHLVKLVVSLFQDYEPHGSPFFVLNLKVDPSKLDINITPDKRDVRLLNNFAVMREVETGLRNSLQNKGEALERGSTQLPRKDTLSVGTSLTQFLGVGTMRDQNGKSSQTDSEEEEEDDDGDHENHCLPAKAPRITTESRPFSSRPASSSRPNTQSSLSSFTYGTNFVTGNEYEDLLPPMDPVGEPDNAAPIDECEDVNEDMEGSSEPSGSSERSQIPNNYQPSQVLGSDIEVFPPDSPEPTATAEPEITEIEDQDEPNDLHENVQNVTRETSRSPPSAIEDIEEEEEEEQPVHEVVVLDEIEEEGDNNEEADTTIQDPEPDPVSNDGVARNLRSKSLNCHISIPTTIADIKASMSQLKSPNHPEVRNFAVDEQSATDRLNLIISKTDFNEMKVIGQFNLGFILVSKDHRNKKEIFIIDQHASDEIYNFETLQKTTVMRRQPLVVPRLLELSAVEELTLVNNLHVFERNGFSIKVDPEAPPGRQCFLTAVPYSKATMFNESDINELIYKISESQGDGANIKCSKLRAMFAMRACRSSIMVGDPLGERSMKKVVTNLGTLDKPWNCPHGRPTLRHITTLE